MGIIKDLKSIYKRRTLRFKSANSIKWVISRTRACVLLTDAWEEMNRTMKNRIVASFAITGFITTPCWK